MKIYLRILAMFFVTINVFTACEEDEEDNGTAPDLPPESAFVMPYDDFNNPEDTLSTSKTIKTYRHWGQSAIHVGVWNLVLTVNLAIPVAAFRESFNHLPVYNSDTKEWEWSYSVNNEYRAKLTGKVDGDSVKWEMYVSKNNGFSDFLWYEGTGHKNRTGGHWSLYYNYLNPEKYLNITWDRDTTNDTGNIKYKNIKENTSGYGSYIHYGKQKMI